MDWARRNSLGGLALHHTRAQGFPQVRLAARVPPVGNAKRDSTREAISAGTPGEGPSRLHRPPGRDRLMVSRHPNEE